MERVVPGPKKRWVAWVMYTEKQGGKTTLGSHLLGVFSVETDALEAVRAWLNGLWTETDSETEAEDELPAHERERVRQDQARLYELFHQDITRPTLHALFKWFGRCIYGPGNHTWRVEQTSVYD